MNEINQETSKCYLNKNVVTFVILESLIVFVTRTNGTETENNLCILMDCHENKWQIIVFFLNKMVVNDPIHFCN